MKKNPACIHGVAGCTCLDDLPALEVAKRAVRLEMEARPVVSDGEIVDLDSRIYQLQRAAEGVRGALMEWGMRQHEAYLQELDGDARATIERLLAEIQGIRETNAALRTDLEKNVEALQAKLAFSKTRQASEGVKAREEIAYLAEALEAYVRKLAIVQKERDELREATNATEPEPGHPTLPDDPWISRGLPDRLVRGSQARRDEAVRPRVGKIETDLSSRLVVLMMGLPYSGKTTLARELSFVHGWPIVSPDAIRVALHGRRFLPAAESMVHTIAETMVRSLLLAGHVGVIVDATHIRREHRDLWRKRGDWYVYVEPMETPVDLCIERALEVGDTEILMVIRDMADDFEELGDDEIQDERGALKPRAGS